LECRNCSRTEDAILRQYRVDVHEISSSIEQQFSLYDVGGDVISDPTLNRTRDYKCPNEDCPHTEAVYYQAGREEDEMILYTVCCGCKHIGRK